MNERDEYNLEPIIDYNMNEDEALAYKIGLLWLEQSHKLFPKHRHYHNYPKKGDPRESNLFKFCYKLQKFTKGLLEPQDFNYYVAAQLQTFKASPVYVLITPQCLIGDKAWLRWKIWKKKFDNINKVKKEVEIEKCDLAEVKSELNKTKKFLDNKFPSLNEEKIIENKKEIERYITLGMISGFYVVLNATIKKNCNLQNMDLSYYENSISEEAKKYYSQIFKE